VTAPPRPATRRAPSAAERRRGFIVVTAILGLFLFAASAPSPLYGVYAARWQFSATSLTAVFAVYALALLATLLLTGSLSDAVGRRPVIAAGLALEVLSMVLFLAADGLSWLYAARVGQGVATGLVTAAVAAALIDLQPPDRPGTGALINAVTRRSAWPPGRWGPARLSSTPRSPRAWSTRSCSSASPSWPRR
jgi:MFS family permease